MLGDPIIWLALVGLFILLAACFMSAWNREQFWADAAKDLDLTFSGSGFLQSPEITGTHNGYALKIWLQKESSPALEISLEADLPSGVRFRRSGVFFNVEDAFGGQEIEVQHEKFNDMVHVKGEHPEEVKAFLTRERMEAMVLFFREFQEATVSQDAIYGRRKGKPDSTEGIKDVVNMGRKLADVLENEHDNET